jgi:hypothetical protein
VLKWKEDESFGSARQDLYVLNYSIEEPAYIILLAPNDVGIGDEGAIVISLDSKDYKMLNVMVAPCASEKTPIMNVKREKFAVLIHPGKNNIIIPYEISPYLDPNFAYICPVSIVHSFGSDTVDINVNKNGKYTKMFNAFVVGYDGKNATLHINSLYDNDITIIDDANISTMYVPEDGEVSFSTSFEGADKFVVVYTDNYAKVFSIERSSFGSSSYILREFYITSMVPSDKNATAYIAFDVNSDTPYVF